MTANQQVCPECTGFVGADEAVCGACGHVLKTDRGIGKRWRWVAAATIVLGVIGVSVLAFGRLQTPDTDQSYSVVNFSNLAASDATTNSADLNATVSNSADATAANVAENLTSLDADDADASAVPVPPPEVAAKIEDWSWESDPDFGTEGAIKWRVSVRNVSDREIASAKVEFSAFDDDHHLVTTTFDYVQNIPPGDTRNEESFADYHGGEATARVAITDIRFAY